MLHNYKKGLLFLIFGFFVTTLSCQKEEEELPDMEASSLTLETSGNFSKLYNEVTLRSTVVDNAEIGHVIFYVNGDSLGKATEAPYELTWNTKEVEDGPYLLRAVAYDASGNKSEATQEVMVKNTLFVLHIDNGHLPQWKNNILKEWIFFSDRKGRPIGEVKQISNGTSLHWERPADFYGDTISFNHLLYRRRIPEDNRNTYDDIDILTYTNATLEEGHFTPRFAVPEQVGQVNIAVVYTPESYKDYLFGTNFTYKYGSYTSLYYGQDRKDTINYSVSVTKNHQKAFNYYEIEPFYGGADLLREKYYRSDEMAANGSYIFHTSEFTPMESQSVIFPFAFEYASINVSGFLNSERYNTNAYYVDGTSASYTQNKELKVFYTDAFPHFSTKISDRTGNKHFPLNKTGKAPETYTLPNYTTTITTEDMKNIQVVTHGSFDLGSGSWSASMTDKTENVDISGSRTIYFSGQSGANYVLPDIPPSLLELFPVFNNKMWYYGSISYDNKAFDSYEGVVKHLLTDDFSDLKYSEYSSLFAEPEQPGGRIQSPHPDSSPEKRVLKYLGPKEILRY